MLWCWLFLLSNTPSNDVQQLFFHHQRISRCLWRFVQRRITRTITCSVEVIDNLAPIVDAMVDDIVRCVHTAVSTHAECHLFMYIGKRCCIAGCRLTSYSFAAFFLCAALGKRRSLLATPGNNLRFRLISVTSSGRPSMTK